MKNTLLFLFALVFSSSVFSMDLKFGSGAEGGSYYSMLEDVSDFCGGSLGQDRKGNDNVFVNSPEGSGAVGNLLGISNKKYVGGMVQEDVLRYYSRQDSTKYNQNNIKIIAGMHTETGHLLIPKSFKPSGGSRLDNLFSFINTKPPSPLSIESLKGQKIAAWGGSIVSAKALSSFLNLDAKVIPIKKESAESSSIPILIVAGQPSSIVQSLLSTNKFILAPIDYHNLQSRQPFYLKMDANYEINGEMASVQTFGIRAYLVGKVYRREASNAPLISLSKCIKESLVDLSDDPETNPNWGSVYDLDQNGTLTNWSYFPI